MYVLVTYKDEENQMKNEGARVVTTLYSFFFRRSRATNSVAGGWMWPKIKLIQTFMGVLVTCKNEGDPFKKQVNSENLCPQPLFVYMNYHGTTKVPRTENRNIT